MAPVDRSAYQGDRSTIATPANHPTLKSLHRPPAAHNPRMNGMIFLNVDDPRRSAQLLQPTPIDAQRQIRNVP
ncbi:MAG: hypothetical protein ACK5TZ_00585, partial [bacterium]